MVESEFVEDEGIGFFPLFPEMLSDPVLLGASPPPAEEAAPAADVDLEPAARFFVEALVAWALDDLLAPEEEEEADDSACRRILFGIKNAGRWNSFRNFLMYRPYVTFARGPTR